MRSVEEWRDVALVPERDVLQRGRGVAADHAGQAADALALLGVALVRHRRGAGLAGQERLLGLAQFGALHVPDLHRELLQRGRDQRQGRDELRVPVALQDLIRYRRDGQAQRRADALLGRGGDRGVRPDGAADLAHADRGRGRVQAGPAAPHLVDPEGEQQTEGHRLGVDAVRAAHHQRALVLARPRDQDVLEAGQFGLQQGGRIAQLQRRRRVPDVGRCQAEVYPAALVAQGVRDGAQEGRYVVVGLRLVAVEVVQHERCAGRDGVGVGLRHDPLGGPGLHGGDLDLQPAFVLGLVGPEGGHGGAGVARDHRGRRAFRCAGVVPARQSR